MTVALKFSDYLTLTRKMPLAFANVALDMNKVIEKHRPLLIPVWPRWRKSALG
ncbi:MAG: hypothetical protein WA728_02995 [Xanthobacteraceae bacterium]